MKKKSYLCSRIRNYYYYESKRFETGQAQLIRKSIEECGYGRSVVIDADGVLIAGNGVASVTDGHTPLKVIETDGSELVVVKRTDLHDGDVKRKKLAMADNAAGDRVEWDEANIADDFEQISLEEFDIAIGKNLEKKLDKKGEYESLYEAPLQLLPKKEYILVLCEQEDFDEAREYFGCGFVADTKAGINNANPVKSRTINFRDYVNSHPKQEQTL